MYILHLGLYRHTHTDTRIRTYVHTHINYIALHCVAVHCITLHTCIHTHTHIYTYIIHILHTLDILEAFPLPTTPRTQGLVRPPFWRQDAHAACPQSAVHLIRNYQNTYQEIDSMTSMPRITAAMQMKRLTRH